MLQKILKMAERNDDANSEAGDGTSTFGSFKGTETNGPQLEAQSRELYSNFLREELQNEGYQIPQDFPQSVNC